MARADRHESMVAHGASGLAVDSLVDDLYRAALCLARDEAGAGDLVEAAVAGAFVDDGQGRRIPTLHAGLRALIAAAGNDLDGDPTRPLSADPETARALAAFRYLPAEVRVPAALYFTQHLTSRQVAELLDLPLDSVRARLSLARRQLRDILVAV